MGKLTLKEQLNEILENKEAVRSEQLEHFFKENKKYEKIFSVSRNGKIEEIEIEYFKMDYLLDGKLQWEPYYDKNKRPSKVLIEIYNDYLNDMISKFQKCVYVYYKKNHGTYTSSAAYKYNDILEKSDLSFNKEDLIKESKRLNDLYGTKENHTACAYCGRQTQNDLLITSTIIGRGRKEVWNSWKGRYESKAYCTNEILKFCSKECAGNEQMSREG